MGYLGREQRQGAKTFYVKSKGSANFFSKKGGGGEDFLFQTGGEDCLLQNLEIQYFIFQKKYF